MESEKSPHNKIEIIFKVNNSFHFNKINIENFMDAISPFHRFKRN